VSLLAARARAAAWRLAARASRDPAVRFVIAELKRRNIAVIPTLARELSVFVYESTPGFSLGERPAAGPGKLD
jgi:hypothetical protein